MLTWPEDFLGSGVMEPVPPLATLLDKPLLIGLQCMPSVSDWHGTLKAKVQA